MHPRACPSARRPGVLVTALLCGLLTAGGCNSEKAEHLKALESSWSELRGALDGEGDTAGRVSRLEAFLQQFPADHPAGNPHADEASTRLTELRAKLKDEQAAQAEAQALQQRADGLWSAVEAYLFGLAVGASGGYPGEPDPATVRSYRLGDTRVMTRGRYGGPLLAGLATAPVQAAEKLLKRTLYGRDSGGYDAEGLKLLLGALPVEPGRKLFDRTVREVYPMFAGAVAFHLQVYAALQDKIGVDTLKQLRADYVAKQGGGDVDLRPFYTALCETQPALHRQIAGFAARHALEVGFWVRRIDDGTAPVIAEFLRRVDGALGRADDDDPTPITIDAATPLQGDALLRVTPHSWNAAVFTPDGKQLAHLGAPGLRLLSSETGAELYRKKPSSPGAWEQLAISGHGKVIAAASSTKARGQKGHVYLYDTGTGEQLADCGGDQDYVFVDLAFTHDDQHIVARTAQHGLRVWTVGVPCEGYAIGMPPDSRPDPAFSYPAAVHPKRPLLVMAKRGALVVYDLEQKTETEVARRPDVRALRFSPSGMHLLVATEARLFVENFNVATGQLSDPQSFDHRVGGALWLPTSDGVVFSSQDENLVYLWRLGAEQPKARFAGGQPLAVSPDGKTLVLSGWGDDLALWSLEKL